ncbi:NADP-dependent oxidoreductase [Microbispora rosea]|uniref:NADP-dependent oxidoreductase n=1 Tax=Microbispora rosea TaxID=58117 RepID=UPI00343C9305
MSQPEMAAVVIDAFGGPEVLRLTRSPRPQPGPGEVQIKVHAVGVNPADWKTRQGHEGALISQFPAVLGWDVAGTVSAAGPGVHAFAVGDRVFGLPAFPQPANTYAEYVTAHVNELAALPDGVTFPVAAGAPLAALTAWQALFEAAKLREGQRVLVNAAAGGVGHIAVQLARGAGAEVLAIASPRNRSFVEGLGATQVLDYSRELAVQVEGPVDVVIDAHGEAEDELAELLRPGGTFVSIVSPDLERFRACGLIAYTVFVHPEGRQLDRVAELLGRGDLLINIDRTFPLDQAADAHAYAERGHTRGKVVLEVLTEDGNPDSAA